MISAVGLSLIILPVPYFFAALLPFADGMFLLFSWGNAAKLTDSEFTQGDPNETLNWNWLVGLMVALIIFRFVLARGIALG